MPSEGKRIQKIRKALGLSQQDFADFFGFARTYLSSIENDNDQLSRKQLSKLLLTYKVNINYVLEGIGDMFIKEQKDYTGTEFTIEEAQQISQRLNSIELRLSNIENQKGI